MSERVSPGLRDGRRPEAEEEVEGGLRVEEPLGARPPEAEEGDGEPGGREEGREEPGAARREERDDPEREDRAGGSGEDGGEEERRGERPGAGEG